MAERLQGFLFPWLPLVESHTVSRPYHGKDEDAYKVSPRSLAVATADGLTGSNGARRAANLATQSGVTELYRAPRYLEPEQAKSIAEQAVHNVNAILMKRRRLLRMFGLPVGEVTFNISWLISFQSNYGLSTASYGDVVPLIKQPGERLYPVFDRYAHKTHQYSKPRSLGETATLGTVDVEFVPLQPGAYVVIPTDGALDHWAGGPENPEFELERMDAIDIFLDKNPSVEEAAEYIAYNPHSVDDATGTVIKIGPAAPQT